MHAENLPQRVERVAGAEALEGISRLDPANPLHVDQAARYLLKRFYADNDPEAFEILIDLSLGKLCEIAEDTCRDVGLAASSEQLVTIFCTQIFTEIPTRHREIRHFLAEAGDGMRAQAQALVRYIAATSIPPPDVKPDLSLVDLTLDDTSASLEDLGGFFAQVVRICFHRLELTDRRLLRARDVEGLGDAALAERLGILENRIRGRLMDARLRLTQAVSDVFHGAQP